MKPIQEKTIKLFGILFLILLLSFTVLSPIHAEIIVVKLSYANPDSVLTTLKSLYGRQLEASTAPMINAIVVRSNDAQALIGIKKLLKSLDRRPSILRFSVKNLSSSNSKDNTIKLSNKRISFNRSNRRTNANNQAVHSITAMEFQKASLTNSISRVVHMGYEGKTMLTADRGLQISGHLANSSSVIVNLWFSAGSFSDSSTLVTSVNAPIGKWFHIGTNSRKENSKPTTTTSINNSNIVVSRHEKNGSNSQNYLIKVDLIQPNH